MRVDERAPRFGEATLTDCDREPIHIPGSIQPHGCLLAVDPATLEVRHCAGPTEPLLGRPQASVLGQTLPALFGPAQAERLARAAIGGAAPAPFRRYELAVEGPQGPLDGMLHAYDGLLMMEFEPASRAESPADALMLAQRMLAALGAAETIDAYQQTCAEEIRAATGFDRVMIYRFLEDGSGKVVAEARRDDLESFLDLHYPESDIPKQARELYLKNWIRCIPDIRYTAAPITPATHAATGPPLDLSFCGLRSVSPLHLEYLNNMGVRASMSISIVHRGALWGLIACHHGAPHRAPCNVRAACEMVAQVFSLQLETRLHAQDYEYRLRQRAVHQRLVARLAGEESLSDGLIRHRPNLLDLVQADGVAVLVGGEFAEIGVTPGRARIAALADRLNAGEDGVFQTDHLAAIAPAVAGPDAAGVLALSVSRSPKDWIFWFRRELVETVTWAGNPHKAITRTHDGERLSPRASFQAWRETVRGRSRPWIGAEIEAAHALRLSILEVVLLRIDQIARERAEANSRQTLLVAELDHRVKNTLATIQALMRHTRKTQDTFENYVLSLERRIKAMAHAQSLLSESRWRGAELRRLVEEELGHYDAGAIRIEGEGIELAPKAALCISMVVHELATNAAKYGALSCANGRLRLDWRVADDMLRLAWRESGGPPVTAPQRRGFGMMLLETSIGYELGGSAQLRFEPEGVACDIAVPLRHVVAGACKAAPGVAPGPGMRVLIVEDSLLTALDVADALAEMGHVVIGPTGRADDALLMIERERPDAAVLDINLGAGDSFAVADRLREAGVPFVFLTGYNAQTVLPERFAHVACVAKPFSERALRAALEAARTA